MKTLYLAGLAFILAPSVANTANVTWDYKNPQDQRLILNLDTRTAQVTLTCSETNGTRKAIIINAVNVGGYVRKLLERIPETPAPLPAIDGDVLKVTFSEPGTRISRTLHSILPPGSLLFNDGYSAERGVSEVDSFRQNLESFFLRDLFDNIMRDHFQSKLSPPTSRTR